MSTPNDMSEPLLRGLVGSSSTKSGSAAAVSYAWLKDHIATIPRDAGVIISEADVALGSQTGRTPAREALQRLEAEGYLQIIPRKGIYIPPISTKDIIAVMDARRVVEEWCAVQTTQRGGLEIEALRTSLDTQESLIGNHLPFMQSDRVFHRAIVEHADNAILAQYYEQLRDRQVRMGVHALALDSERSADVIVEHRAIVEAIASGDPERARASVVAHLDTTTHALLRRV